MINLNDLEKKINSELTTKIKKTEIKHNQIFIEIDKEDLIFIKIDKAKKISAYVFLKALGLKDADIKN